MVNTLASCHARADSCYGAGYYFDDHVWRNFTVITGTGRQVTASFETYFNVNISDDVIRHAVVNYGIFSEYVWA